MISVGVLGIRPRRDRGDVHRAETGERRVFQRRALRGDGAHMAFLRDPGRERIVLESDEDRDHDRGRPDEDAEERAEFVLFLFFFLPSGYYYNGG